MAKNRRVCQERFQRIASYYEYDPFGNRVASIENGVRTEYFLDPVGFGDVVGEFDGSGEITARYTYGVGLATQSRSSDVFHYDFDALGSTVGVTGVDGAYVNQYQYAPFGTRTVGTENIDNSFEYIGQFGVMGSNNGLDYMRARYFAADLGRFVSPDPIGVVAGDMNLYRYVENNPISNVDPTGLFMIGTRNGGHVKILSRGGEGLFRVQLKVAGETLHFAATSGYPGRGAHVAKGLKRVTHYYFNETVVTRGSRVVAPITKGIGRLGLAAGAGVAVGLTAAVALELWGALSIGQDIGGLLNDLGAQELIERHFDSLFFPEGGTAGTRGDGGVSSSMDPNEKTGPSGAGPQHFVRPTGVLPYRIDFENDETATAPAQRVDVTDQLSDRFDWDSFQLTEVGFGDVFVTIPSGRQYFRTTVEMAYNDKTFDVEIEIGLDLQTGLISAHFQSVDPATQLPPDVLTGFLPPEDGTGRGMGHFSYTIELVDGLLTGTEIRNVAIIQFDHGEIIATNQVDPHDPSQGTDPDLEALVTIDAGAPDSVVSPLAAVTTSTSFTVSWSGTDDAGGSGVAAYNVFVSDNGGPFVLWQIDTTLTEATYDGEDGHTYAFYSVAQDSVGHAEVKLPAADTQTRIQQRRPEDVDDDMDVDVVDALIVINNLLTYGPRELDEPATSQPYLDVNNDGQLGVIDAILVINYLLNPPSPSFLPERVFPAESESPSKLGEVSGEVVESGTDLDWDTLALGTAMDRAAKERRSIDGFFSQLNDPIDMHQENDAWTESLAD